MSLVLFFIFFFKAFVFQRSSFPEGSSRGSAKGFSFLEDLQGVVISTRSSMCHIFSKVLSFLNGLLEVLVF